MGCVIWGVLATKIFHVKKTTFSTLMTDNSLLIIFHRYDLIFSTIRWASYCLVYLIVLLTFFHYESPSGKLRNHRCFQRESRQFDNNITCLQNCVKVKLNLVQNSVLNLSHHSIDVQLTLNSSKKKKTIEIYWENDDLSLHSFTKFVRWNIWSTIFV